MCVSSQRFTIIKTKGRAMRMLAMANEDTLAETRKARPTPARLTRDMVREKHMKASKAGFSPKKVVDTCKQEDRHDNENVHFNKIQRMAFSRFPLVGSDMAERSNERFQTKRDHQ